MSNHNYLNAVEKSEAVPNVRESVQANTASNDAAAHGQEWQNAIDRTQAKRVQRHNEKAYGSKSHSDLRNLNDSAE